MSFNLLSYDNCAYTTKLTNSVSVLDYMLDPIRYEHCSKCMPEIGIVGGTAVSNIRGNLVDLENQLQGRDRPNTHCPSYKYIPSSNNIEQGKEYIKPVCHPPIDTNKLHLKSCQFFDTKGVPHPPKMDLFKCPTPKK